MYLTISIVLVVMVILGWWLTRPRRTATYQELLAARKSDFEKQPGTPDEASSLRYWGHLPIWGQRRNASDGQVKLLLPPENISQLRLFEIQCFLFARTMHHIGPFTTQETSMKIVGQLFRDLLQSSMTVLGLGQKEISEAILLRKETYTSYLSKDEALPLHYVLANFILASEDEGRPTTKVPPPTQPQDPDNAMSHGFIVILQGAFDDIALPSILDVLEGWMFRYKATEAAHN
ncbi:MAG: hypothetical protein EOP88_10670 [Verrucomicrobiaceae bacterium]|nr:MAG: hypothetical protein EOP88_10670 [Verrucomicrobiaceae bacterium]